MRILSLDTATDLKKAMQDIRVDKYGIDIMYPKALTYLVKINNISNITANILKQEMLSLGADCAVSRDCLTGKTKQTDCLLMGNFSQFNRLNSKLKSQPFGLDRLSGELAELLKNYDRENFTLDLGRYKLKLGLRRLVMGIVNLTPDSFSGDGLYGKRQTANGRWQIDNAIKYVEKMVDEGADIIDLGGESSRPGARPVSVKEELSRTIPLVKALAKKIKVPLSIDTYKPEVARAALDCGVSMVNDITGLHNKKMARIVAKYKCACVAMHMKGRPQQMQKRAEYHSLIDEIIEYLAKSIDIACDNGVDREKIIIDPGIGFGKTLEHNLKILKSLKEFKVLGRPIMVGTSRKSFLGKILQEPAEKRIFGTLASCVLAVLNGAQILRVHDCKEAKQALKVLEAVNQAC